jgi:hypothetical protein
MYYILFLINNVVQYIQIVSKGRGFLDDYLLSIFMYISAYNIITIKINIKIAFASFLFVFVFINHLFTHLQVQYMYKNKFDFNSMCECMYICVYNNIHIN